MDVINNVDISATTSSISTISPFLRPGSSYDGKSAHTRLENSLSTVAVLVSIDNWTRWKLLEPETQITCGSLSGQLPESVKPGHSEMAFFEKGGGFTGVCGVISYRFDMDSEEVEEPHYLNVMWSVPYNLNSYSAYLAVGVSHMYLNSTEGSRELFDQLYYYTGPFERATAGQLVEYSSESERVRVRGTMVPDTYKPILSVSVLPMKSEDGFQNGKYFEPTHSSSATQATNFGVFPMSIMLLVQF